MNVWSRAAAVAMGILLAGCADGAKLVQEDDHGGVVVYPFKEEQGPLLSPFRTDALAIITHKCGRSYTIVREGEAKGRSRIVSPVEGTEEVVRERRWGIRFQCK
jgi:hypothetical protein